MSASLTNSSPGIDFYFVRHGESTNNTLFAEQYPNDRPAFEKVRKANPDLTDQGKAQADLVGDFLRKVFMTGESQLSEATPSATTSADSPVVSQSSPSQQGIAEIWSSYLARAIETALAIQQAAAVAGGSASDDSTPTSNDSKRKHEVPAIRLNESLTEVGGHYEYDAESDAMVATPGYTNKDVIQRWGRVAKFVELPCRNDDVGWNRRAKRETPGEGRERALSVIRLMESHVMAAAAHHLHQQTSSDSGHGFSYPGINTNVMVITHGDFFKQLLTRLSQVGSKDPEDRSKPPLDVGTVSVEGLPGQWQMSPTVRHMTRTSCPRLQAAANMKVRNTSINHLRVELDKSTKSMRWSSKFLDRVDHLEGSKVAVIECPPSIVKN
jgi:broad specificity phosphatase PhoE